MRRALLILSLAVASAFAAAPGARAMGLDAQDLGVPSLASLADGGSLTSGNGELVFTDFEVIAAGSLDHPLSFYKVIALEDGFAITGPTLSAANGDSGSLEIRYTVTSAAPITGATLAFDAVASGKGSFASVEESFDSPVEIELFVLVPGEGGGQRQDSVDLDGLLQLRVTKSITVDAASAGDWVWIKKVEQRFASAPEPATLLLLGASLAALAAARARRL